MRSLKDHSFNGKAVLQVVIESSEYKNLPQAVAALTLFSHPLTVEQTRGFNLFKVVRCRSMSDRGKYECSTDGTEVMLDDNTAPTETFIWANCLSRSLYQDVQFNHIWSDSKNVTLYTSLANVCVSPAFLAKLTDTDEYIRGLLRFRAYELYDRFAPYGTQPNKPSDYETLSWADPLPPTHDLEHQLRTEMARKRTNRTVGSARRVGWLFSDYQPDAHV